MILHCQGLFVLLDRFLQHSLEVVGFGELLVQIRIRIVPEFGAVCLNRIIESPLSKQSTTDGPWAREGVQLLCYFFLLETFRWAVRDTEYVVEDGVSFRVAGIQLQRSPGTSPRG
jgi:hypothetical protein